MTTPDESGDRPTEQVPAADQTPTAEQTAAPAPPPPQTQPPQTQPPYPPYAQYPFAPYPFPPRIREPWINPAKRAVVTTIAIVAALVLLGGGVLIGAGAAWHHGNGRSMQPRFAPGMRVGPPGWTFHGPRYPRTAPTAPGSTASPSAS